jgi:hypothetical protein
VDNILTIVIPSKNEKFLKNTILDVLDKATGDIEIFPTLDGYEIPENDIVNDPRVKYINFPKTDYTKKRHMINHVVDICEGEYIMSLDAHCMMDKGFDEVLKREHREDWVQIPRRQRLDAEKWCLQTQVDKRPPIDYEYTMWPLKFDRPALHGFKWDARTLANIDKPIDDTMHFQGSCWFMTKDYFKYLGLMQIDGYTGWGQEAEEISMKVRKDGGRVITNKKTWYAHLHKGEKYGRMYYMSNKSVRDCNSYSYNLWVNENKQLFVDYIEKFWPVPEWPEDWRDQIWKL